MNRLYEDPVDVATGTENFMRREKRLATLTSWLLTAVVACGENVTGPATRELTLSVCPTKSWVAYQNEGGPWTRLGGSGGGDVTIMATDRLALAHTNTNTQPPWLFLYFISADQAQRVLGCSVPNEVGIRSLSGTVQGLTPSNLAQLSIGPYSTWLDVTSDTFTFWYAAEGTRDLFAMRIAEIAEGDRVDRMIIRRAQAHADGAIPLLDFESSEAISPAENVLSWTASGGHVVVDFLGADGNFHHMQSALVGANGAAPVPWTLPLYSVPASRQVASDLHMVNLFNEDRSVRAYYHQPQDMTLTLGPALMDPTFIPIATTPSLRVQANLPWQPQYDGHVTIQLTQQGAEGPRVVNITVTREHVASGGTGAPAALPTWSATLPDLSAVAGLPSGLGLEAGTPFDWTVVATSRRWDASSTVIAAGDVHRSAAHYGTSGN